jgi:hypothetical protein
MPAYMVLPQSQLTLGTTAYSNINLTAIITRLENGFDTATFELPDGQSYYYPTVTNGTAFQFDVKDASEASYTTLSKGIVRFPILPYGNNELLQLKCDGVAYGLKDTVVAQEYGTQSSHPTLDTINEILTDATYGILTKYVNKILGSATNSGFSYTSILEAAGGGDIVPYVYFPYKPCNKAIDDLIDLITAVREGSAGHHWIVTTDDVFHLKSIDETQVGWTKYYGDSQTDSTLEQGKDFTQFQFEPIGPEANYIIYNGTWIKPSSRDYCEGNASDYVSSSPYNVASDDTVKYIVGSQGIRVTNSASTGVEFKYPESQDAAWDFTFFTGQNIPSFQFYLLLSDLMSDGGSGLVFAVKLATDNSNYFWANLSNSDIASIDTWTHFSFPIGPSNKTIAKNGFTWNEQGSPDWADINYFWIFCPMVNYAVLDGAHFGAAQVTRIAKNSTNITSNKVKMKTLTDIIGKDDTLTSGTVGTTDTGLMARMAYMELLRLQTTSIVGTVTVPMLKDALPGQWFHIHAKKNPDETFNIDKDMRATKVIHVAGPTGYYTTLNLTDDLTNSHPRPAYEDRNKIVAATRPDYQDAQATSIKAGNVDIRVTPLEEDYPS